MSNFKKFIVGVIFAVAIFAPTFSFAQANPNAGIEAQVDSYFADIPVMISIAKCESGFREFNADGSILYGGNGSMVGVFQLDGTVHRDRALALGFDINTVNGNLGYARYLFGALGSDPWISSFGCWNVSAAEAATTTPATSMSSTTPILTEDLSLGTVDSQVLILQQTLNHAGFTLATSGAGSPGNETTKFGALTRAAVRSFQCAQGIACSGSEATTGYGFVNAQTRSALLAFVATPTESSSTTGTTSTIITNNPAEIAQLNAQIVALLSIITQLEARIAANGK
jgi:hypothetical protein